METLERLHIIWEQTFGAYVDGPVGGWDLLVGAYSKKGRHYHSLSHLGYLFDELEASTMQPSDREAFAAAIFFHDIVYAINRKDNETKSANRASAFLRKLKWPEDRVKVVANHILATAKHQNVLDEDTALFIDLDLAILGDTRERYTLYTEQIRKEYWMYPDFLYRRGRSSVLKHFLDKEAIYISGCYGPERERQARKNMEGEVETL